MTEIAPTPWDSLIRTELSAALRRPLVWACIAFLLGILWADWLAPPLGPLLLIAWIAAGLTGYAAWRLSVTASRLILPCCFLLGAALHTARLQPLAGWRIPPEGLSLPQIEGLVLSASAPSPKGQRLLVDWRGPHGETYDRVSIFVLDRAASSEGTHSAAPPPWRVGDYVQLFNVTLRPPPPIHTPGEIGAARQLARRGIHLEGEAERSELLRRRSAWHASLSDSLVCLRRHFLEILQQGMPGPTPELYASLLASLVFGISSAPVPEEIVEIFRRSGTIHILVASGAQISLIALALIFLVQGRRLVLPIWGIFLIGLALTVFALLAGFEISMRRALGMAFLLLGTYAWGRRYDLPSALALTALVLSIWDTSIIFEAGTQLTYACTLGVYLAWPAEGPARSRGRFLLAAAASSTFGAWLLATPILVAHFHQLTLLGTLANLLAVPLATLLLPIGLGAIVLGLIWPPLALPLCAVSRWLLEIMLTSNRLFASLPGATLERLYLPAPWLALSYVVIAILFAVWRSRALRERLRYADWRWAFAGACALLALAVFWSVMAQPASSRLLVHVLDVGAGQCVLIEAPSGKILLDAGADPQPGRAEQIFERRISPFFALRHVRRLEAIVLSHAHEDHCNLAPKILATIPTAQLLLGPATGAETSWPAMLHMARTRGVRIERFLPGGRLRLGPMTELEALGPPENVMFAEDPVNNGSLVMRLMHGETAVLFPADIGAEGEEWLRRAYPQPGRLHANVLLAPHHGSARSCTRPFIQAVAPRFVVISCGGGRFAPKETTLQLFGMLGLPVWRTDQHGTITIASDGRRITIQPTVP